MRIAALVCTAVLVSAQDRAPAIDSIRADDLRADLYFLASDAMRGRLTGTPEVYLAASWVESRLKRLGLKPVGGESIEHRYNLTWATLAQGNSMRITGGAAVMEPRILEDFMPLFFSPSARAEAEVVFVGYGIHAPELNWDDLGGGINGRVALMLDGEPGANDPKSIFDGVVTSIHSDPMRKALYAQAQGAAGVLFVNPSQRRGASSRFASEARSYWPEKPPHLKRYAITTWAEELRIPVASISPAIAAQLAGDRDLPALGNKSSPPTQLLGRKVGFETRLNRHVIDDWNMVAMIGGSDAKLKDEAIIVSAHYDHNGTDGSQIFNGADDNGSGTVGLLEIAEAYAQAARDGRPPRRTVIFAAWGSEERCCGPLLGASAWVRHPSWPLAKTTAVLNMDMIGRREEVPENGGARFRGLPIQTAASNADAVNVIGTSYSPDMRKAANHANRAVDMTLRFRYDNNPSNLLRRSDQWPFLNNGVPALWFHTGLHPDYHTTFDRPERIDYAKMERVARLVYQMSWDLANGDGRPAILRPRPIPEPD